MHSEILLNLPCDEDLWTAESAQEWHNRCALMDAEHNTITFANALSHELRPSTFGCLVLISALHNYIWETRTRHHGRQWTQQETQSMFSPIEPALNAWQAAWKANDHHKLERPNPFGLGPLSSDSIPLLDLAFVRLFVNLDRCKEAFWQRDFDAMANELSRGTEIVQHVDRAPGDDAEEAAAFDMSLKPVTRGGSGLLVTSIRILAVMISSIRLRSFNRVSICSMSSHSSNASTTRKQS
ncbi:hypothetical protein LTR17_026113 [Elasticomyces elasticus]|nr:hypothetical protein LTR17_026113 [Elasticomyces elasticus]